MFYSRIVIYGAPGSGKTYIATKLSQVLSIPKYSIDDFFWKKGWEMSSSEELKEKVIPIIETEKWILDGNYSEIRPLSLEKAQLAIILRLPIWRCIWNIFIRTLYRNLKIKKKNITPLPKEIEEKDVGIKNFFPALFVLSKYSIRFRFKSFKKILSEVRQIKTLDVVVIKRKKEVNKIIEKLEKNRE